MTNTGNNIATLAGNTGDLNYVDSDAFTVGTVNLTDGIAATGTVELSTLTGDLTVAADIAKTAGGDASLILKSYRDILFNSGFDITSSTGALDVVLNAHYSSDVAEGSIYLAGSNSISTNGGDITMGGGTNPLTISAIAHAVSEATYDKRGILAGNNTSLNAAGGDISLLGEGNNSFGIQLLSGTTVTTSNTGSIYMRGSSTNVSSAGIVLREDSTFSTTGTGDIELDGQNLLRMNGEGGPISILSTNGNLILKGDSLALANTWATLAARMGL